MRRTKVIGWGLALACACGLMTEASASAELPELGRCVKVTTATGAYTRANCLPKSKTHTGEYEWLPGPGANNAFQLKLSQPTFETVNGRKIGCAFLFATGEFTGAKSEKISEVVLQGCALFPENLACYTHQLEPNKVVSKTPLIGELGDIPGSINPANPWLGWDLKAESGTSPTIVEFSCGESGVFPPPPPTFKVSLEGSVIGRVTKTNKMQTVFAMVYKQEHGIQKPTAFIGGTEDVLTQITTPVASPTNPKVEQAGLNASGELVPGEALELKAKA